MFWRKANEECAKRTIKANFLKNCEANLFKVQTIEFQFSFGHQASLAQANKILQGPEMNLNSSAYALDCVNSHNFQN